MSYNATLYAEMTETEYNETIAIGFICKIDNLEGVELGIRLGTDEYTKLEKMVSFDVEEPTDLGMRLLNSVQVIWKKILETQDDLDKRVVGVYYNQYREYLKFNPYEWENFGHLIGWWYIFVYRKMPLELQTTPNSENE